MTRLDEETREVIRVIYRRTDTQVALDVESGVLRQATACAVLEEFREGVAEFDAELAQLLHKTFHRTQDADAGRRTG